MEKTRAEWRREKRSFKAEVIMSLVFIVVTSIFLFMANTHYENRIAAGKTVKADVMVHHVPHLKREIHVEKQEIHVEKPVQEVAKTYTVKAGDSLWDIAAQQYGDGAQWTKLLNANSHVIDGNGSLIYPGQVLTIPSL